MFELDALKRLFHRLVWTDAVEILVIGLAVHTILRFLKGTRGARLLRGFIVVLLTSTVVLYVVANALDLERIKILYWPFVAAMFLVALVAFQPELRRALIRLGATGWFVESSHQTDRVIDEIVSSVTYLSKNKIGALIAFERATELGGLIESGCPLDAEVTARLLNTVFWPGSALHDMGVVVSQARIAAAGVQFPLTESAELDPALGSRHRAAVGLSEDSDAVILVVSEETGVISVVEQSRMHRFLEPDSLRQVLKKKLTKPAKKGE
ncbi:MAG: diadenylate cyclase CdaA [Phycisphaerae bacterium]